MMRFQEFAPVYPCKSFDYEPPLLGCAGQSVLLNNELAQPVTLQWYAGGGAIPLRPGMNRLELPRFQQIERARVAYSVCAPRCRLRWAPWQMLQMGHSYRIYDCRGELQLGHLAQNF
jgi:hypothetical protein